jgi:tetratricopeptide (TPR) repeat protein
MLCRVFIAISFFLFVSVHAVGLPAATAGEQVVSPGDAAEAHIGKGYEYVQSERYVEAAKEFRAALALNANLPRVRYQLAVCLFATGQREESRVEFDRLLRETSGDPALIYYLGRLDLLDGKIESAVRRLESVAAAPPFPDTSYYLGTAYMKKDELRRAEEWLKDAAKQDPRDFRVHDHLARLYQKAGRAEEAEKEYALSTELRQSYNEASRQSVACSHDLETVPLEQARKTCRKLFAPDDSDKLTTLGMLYGGHGYFEEASEPLQQAEQLDPESFEIEHNLGLTYFRLKRYKDARGPLEKAVALRPDFFGSIALLGATLFALREDERAFHALSKAHRLDPQDADTDNLLFKVAGMLARKKYDQEDYAGCLEYLKTAAQIYPSDVEVHRRLAEVYGHLGRREDAGRESREAERLSAGRR